MPRLTAARKKAIDEVMKKAVFDGAVAVLTEYGVEGMTMDRVASATGIAKGSLYNYFCSKTELLQFIYTKTVDPIFNDLEETLATEQPAIVKLESHLHQILEYSAKHMRTFRLLFDDDTVRGLLHSTERNTKEVISHRMSVIFRQGIEEGAFRPLDPLLLARLFFGVCTCVFDSHPQLEGRDDRQNVHQLIMNMFLKGVASENHCGG